MREGFSSITEGVNQNEHESSTKGCMTFFNRNDLVPLAKVDLRFKSNRNRV